MENVKAVAKLDLPPSAKRRRTSETTWTLCLLCQLETAESISEPKNKESYVKLYNCITERATWNERNFVELKKCLGDLTSTDFETKHARWHRSCYQNATHKGHMERAHKMFMEQHQSSPKCDSLNLPYTRAKTTVYVKSVCIFCDKGATTHNKLHLVQTDSAGEKLLKAVELSNDDRLRVRVNESIKPADAHAIDVMYHKNCWNKNVSNKLRQTNISHEKQNKCVEVSDIEFINSLKIFLEEGHVVSMAELENMYKNICTTNGVPESEFKSRRQIKKLIEEELLELDVVFNAPKRKNESERISLKAVKDVVMAQAEDENVGDNLRNLYSAAKCIRRLILGATKWNFEGSFLQDNIDDVVPMELFYFFKWCLVGQVDMSHVQASKSSEVNSRAVRLSQSLMYECMTPRQVTKTDSQLSRHINDVPVPLAVGIAVHKETRSKKLIQILNGFGCCVDYHRILQLEDQIVCEVLQRIEENDGVYIPHDLTIGRFIFCAADNIDFQEDTRDGKRTLHGTVMVVYQELQEDDTRVPFMLTQNSHSESQTKLALTEQESVHLRSSNKCKPPMPVLNVEVNTKMNSNVLKAANLDNTAWLLLQSLSVSSLTGHLDKESDDLENVSLTKTNNAYTWSAYNSLVGSQRKRTRTCVLPLIAESPTDSQTQIKFMKTLENINAMVQGSQKKVVVTLDMGLYRPVKRLEFSHADNKNKWILRPGELHIIMAQLRTIGKYIDGTGIPELWVESNIYGPATVKQILEGRHVRRGLEAHRVMLISLFALYQEKFFDQYPEVKQIYCSKMNVLSEAFSNGDVKTAHEDLVSALACENIINKFESFDSSCGEMNPTFKVVRQYMKMVESMLAFVRSVRTGEWDLHLSSLHDFTKYFFALDLFNYSSMIAWYLAEMETLKTTDPEIWEEFKKGNWVVNKSQVPFCSLGADEALEHENRAMKVTGGIVGITLNENARTRFFLSSPELIRLVKEAKEMAGFQTTDKKKHHELSQVASGRQSKNVLAMLKTLERVGNPFEYTRDELLNISTMCVMPQKTKEDMCNVSTIGQEQFTKFTTERIMTGQVNLWDPITKLNLSTCKQSMKKVQIKMKDTILELKQDRDLFARMLIVARSRPQVDVCDTISNYELSVVPRSMFAPDGTMLHCSQKSKLMELLESLPDNSQHEYRQSDVVESMQPNISGSVAIIDAMAELQALDKPTHIKTCSDLADHFISRIKKKYCTYKCIHLIFDTYIEDSLKQFTRAKRRGNVEPTHYRIHPEAVIHNVSKQKLLSHEKTKDELSNFLAEQFLKNAAYTGQDVVVAWRQIAKGTNECASLLSSTHEEADAKIILHAIEAKKAGVIELDIFSPDTDVLVLALSKYTSLPQNTKFITGSGERKRTIPLQRIHIELGNLKAEALVGLHSISGADITGSFHKKGKLSFWKPFMTADNNVLHALANLGKTEVVSDDVMMGIERFLCKVYVPSTTITTIGELRWWLFTQKQVVGENLPPTKSSLRLAVLRAHLQAMEWHQCDQRHPSLPNPTQFGWQHEDGQLVPITCNNTPAPQAILELVKCSCVKTRCQSVRCKCSTNSLPCTEMCSCGGDEDLCGNSVNCDTFIFESDDEAGDGFY